MKFPRLLVFLPFLLVACSSSDSNNSSSNEVLPANDAPGFDGAYEVTALSSVRFDNDGAECGGATGTMTIAESVVTGSVLGSASGQVFDLSGSVDGNGNLVAGIANSGQTIVTYEGSIVGNIGSGTWSDLFGCVGTWEMQRVTQ